MKTTEIKNEGGASVKYDIVNIGCEDCPYCMMAEGHYLCRSDKSCNAKANMTDDDEPKQKVIIYFFQLMMMVNQILKQILMEI